MREYEIEVVVHMQVLVKVIAHSAEDARQSAIEMVRENKDEGDVIDWTVTDTYINE